MEIIIVHLVSSFHYKIGNQCAFWHTEREPLAKVMQDPGLPK